jgi:serine protease AprX
MTKPPIAAMAFLAVAANLSYGQHISKVSADLEGRDPEAAVKVIVQYKQTPQQRHFDEVASRGGRHLATIGVVNGAVYSIAAKALAELAKDPDVVFISPDRPVNATDVTSQVMSGSPTTMDYKLQAVNADLAQRAGWNGTGIGVAVIDSGITQKPDLYGSNGSRVVYSQNFIQSEAELYKDDTTSDDTYGHGTHVAGIVGGNGYQSWGLYAGVAPNVNLINLMVLDNKGSGTDSTVIAAIERAIQLKSQYNIRVINLSLGRPVFESYTLDPLCQAVEAAWNAGIVVVVAAGNDGRDNSAKTNGYGTITAPGNDPYVITVGAMKTEGTLTRSDDMIASYSSKGPTLVDHIAKPDLVAPGNEIISILGDGTLPAQYPANITDRNYFVLSGTSMATPMVSGAVALLLQQNSNLTPDQIKARLMKTANKNFPVSSVATDPKTHDQYTSYYDLFTVGAGYLDVLAALTNNDTPNGTALSPVASYNAKNGTVSIADIAGLNVIWGTNLIWGTNVIWGTSVVSGNNVIWGTNLIWGTSSLSGFNVIWGTSLTGGTNTPASEAVDVAINGEL